MWAPLVLDLVDAGGALAGSFRGQGYSGTFTGTHAGSSVVVLSTETSLYCRPLRLDATLSGACTLSGLLTCVGYQDMATFVGGR